MTPEQIAELAELERLEAAATPPPWSLVVTGDVQHRRVVVDIGKEHGWTPHDVPDSDAQLIAALRNLALELIAAAKRDAEWQAKFKGNSALAVERYLTIQRERAEKAEKDSAHWKATFERYADLAQKAGIEFGQTSTEFIATNVRAEKAEAELALLREDKARLELAYRKHLWLSHGHTGLYGDDGEMQCGACLSEGGPVDYKRAPLQDIENHIYEMRMRKAIDAARKLIKGAREMTRANSRLLWATFLMALAGLAFYWAGGLR